MGLWQQYLRPQNLADALHTLAALSDSGEAVAVVAGGTDILLDLDQGRHAAVETLVDVTAVEEMLEIRQVDETVHIGAAVPLREVIDDALVRANATALVEACELIGGPQVRNVATLGGNVAHALPAADGTIALLALGAEAQVASAQGATWIPMEELFVSPGEPSFDRAHDLVVRFRFPALREGEASAFRRIMRPQGVAIAILNMGARLRSDESGIIQEARLAIGPAGPRPRRAWATEQAIEGNMLDEDSFWRALNALREEVSLRTSPHRATAEYRSHLLASLLRQTLVAALSRVGQEV
ncbi:MAG: xanthine dehydrogenase family protein subunit M [Anaerolineae bacterium]|nr:MAG: xanthine dehydrogenase family protein subunit M [Anaerolineae bacterium]